MIYPFGFILIESKSIAGIVKVNEQGEWSRTVNNRWQGMSSPLKQVELQEKLLKEFLHHNREVILPKFLGIQQTMNGRQWHGLCAVSSNAVLERSTMPEEVSNKVVKSEFIQDEVNTLMNLRKNMLHAVTDSRVSFSKEELNSITSFLLEASENKKVIETDQHTIEDDKSALNVVIPLNNSFTCKHCGEKNELVDNYGRFGYYVTCNTCEKTTAMKCNCPCCQSKNTKVSKKEKIYTLTCLDCSHQHIVFNKD